MLTWARSDTSRFGFDCCALVFCASRRTRTRPLNTPRERPPSASLLTRSGDQVGVDLLELRDGEFRFRLEAGIEVVLPAAALSALTLLGDDRRFLSSLQPDAVAEASYFAEGDDAL